MIVTNAGLTVEIDGEEYKLLVARYSKAKQKEAMGKIAEKKAPVDELEAKIRETEELKETLSLILAAAAAAPAGMEKVGLYKDALVIRGKIALEKDLYAQYEKALRVLEEDLEQLAKIRFNNIVVDGKETLQRALEEKNITYVEILTEIDKTFAEIAKKKSQTSDAGQKREQSGERSGEA